MSATPGPWVLSPWTGEDGGAGWGIGLPADQWINVDAASEHSEANAKLIAASPDLADTLCRLLFALSEANLTPAQTAALAEACEAGSQALIKSGRVMG